MKKKAKPPYNIYVRYIENGKKFSVGEYIRAKWNNVCDPFLVNDQNAIKELKRMIEVYQLVQQRTIVLVDYRGSEAAEELSKLIQ